MVLDQRCITIAELQNIDNYACLCRGVTAERPDSLSLPHDVNVEPLNPEPVNVSVIKRASYKWIER